MSDSNPMTACISAQPASREVNIFSVGPPTQFLWLCVVLFCTVKLNEEEVLNVSPSTTRDDCRSLRSASGPIYVMSATVNVAPSPEFGVSKKLRCGSRGAEDVGPTSN